MEKKIGPIEFDDVATLDAPSETTGNKSASVGGLYDIHIDEMIEILRDLAVEKLPNWHSGCNAYCTKEMKEYEIKIDKLFEKIGI